MHCLFHMSFFAEQVDIFVGGFALKDDEGETVHTLKPDVPQPYEFTLGVIKTPLGEKRSVILKH